MEHSLIFYSTLWGSAGGVLPAGDFFFWTQLETVFVQNNLGWWCHWHLGCLALWNMQPIQNPAMSVVRRHSSPMDPMGTLCAAHGNPNVTPESLPVCREWVPVIVRPGCPPVRELPSLSRRVCRQGSKTRALVPPPSNLIPSAYRFWAHLLSFLLASEPTMEQFSLVGAMRHWGVIYLS